MKLFLDTASVAAVAPWVPTGLIDGITTNPTSLRKEQSSLLDIAKGMAALLPEGDISVQVTEVDPKLVYAQAHKIARVAENIIVKIPCDVRYYEVINKLSLEGVALNITLVFSVAQALMMAKLGVAYVSAFVRRLDEAGGDGLQLVADIHEMLDFYDYETELLAASLHTVDQLEKVALYGADAATISVALLQQATNQPLTAAGLNRFEDDWASQE